MKPIEMGKYDIEIYGDGLKEYEGYYMVVIVEYDKQDKQVGEDHVYYFKANSKDIVISYLERNIDYTLKYRDYAKWVLEPIINAIKVPE